MLNFPTLSLRRKLAGYTRTLGISAALGLTCASSSFSQPNMVIRDCAGDAGIQPSACGGGIYWNSPDIWCTPTSTGMTHVNPVGPSTFVRVRLKNYGLSTLGAGVVHVYYGSAHASLTNWPTHWINYVSGLYRGDEIGSACIDNIPPNGEVIVTIPWVGIPLNAPCDHWCMIARFKSVEDPMTPGETANIHYNVPQHNNIAMKNLTTNNPGHPCGGVVIGNLNAGQVTANIHFDADLTQGNGSVFDVMDIRVDLGEELFAKWNERQLGEGISANAATNSITIKTPNAWIGGLTFGPREAYRIEAHMLYSEDIPGDIAGDVYYWNISQHNDPDGEATVVGGETFEIHMSNEPGPHGKAVRRPSPELGTKLDLKAQPNMSKAGTAISFSLPSETKVTLGIYDASGQLVRTLLSDEYKASGSHEIPWDGKLSNGDQVANGTYFYRLSTPEGSVEKQLKIVR